MRSIRYICAQPADLYYAWQVEVMINNFVANGIDIKDIDIVCAKVSDEISTEWIKLKNGYEANFYFYDDTREDKSYIPSLQAHILEKHWIANCELECTPIFFHDADFLFVRPFDFAPFLEDDNWYFSDTISYIGSTYILSKGQEVFDTMCDAIGIRKQLVLDNQRNSGGAQKLFKNISQHYWRKVYEHQMKLYKAMQTVAHIKKENDPYGIQIWTASMWAELWTGLMMGKQIRVPKEFDFCFAVDNISVFDRLSFYHNAGVSSSNDGYFFKGDYINQLPYNNCSEPSKEFTSHFYWEWIEKTAKVTKLL
jgi:hypothetical protein